ncbi:MAG: hypothetical protein GF383_12980 [Candidatus Lokiarchaeota archaeon]|nr:hypothetical protein [Candidatus Lokiarchaeota archaeon]MBD3342021.1 hypothetical protein [Candidatus Lokiarchaeota archaeon]
MEEFPNNDINKAKLLRKYYKPSFKSLFNRIKDIRATVKNDLLNALLDGQWHSETDLIRFAKKHHHTYVGSVTLGTMINSLNKVLSNNYLEKKFENGEMHYKISDNYVGLTRAAYNRYRFRI